jgi:hypothetical protein
LPKRNCSSHLRPSIVCCTYSVLLHAVAVETHNLSVQFDAFLYHRLSLSLRILSPSCHLWRDPRTPRRYSSVSQTIVFRYKEMMGILCTKDLINGIVSFKKLFRQEHKFLFRMLSIPDFFVVEHYGLRNTSSSGS